MNKRVSGFSSLLCHSTQITTKVRFNNVVESECLERKMIDHINRRHISSFDSFQFLLVLISVCFLLLYKVLVFLFGYNLYFYLFAFFNVLILCPF